MDLTQIVFSKDQNNYLLLAPKIDILRDMFYKSDKLNKNKFDKLPIPAILSLCVLAFAITFIKGGVLELIANFIHPENSDTAMKFLNRNAITEEVILDAEDMLRVGYDEDQVIEYLFDIIYKE